MQLAIFQLAALAAAGQAIAYDMTYSTTTTTITSCGPQMTCGASSLAKPVAYTTSSRYASSSSSWGGRYDPQSSSYTGWSSRGWSAWADPESSSTSTRTWGAWPDPTSTTTYTSTSTTGWGDWSDPTTVVKSTRTTGWGGWADPTTVATSTSTPGWGDWADPTVTVSEYTSTYGWGWASYTTDVVTAITTYCPYATRFTQDGRMYTVTSETTLTITDCPCTRTRAVYSASTYTDGYWTAIETIVDPSWTPTWTAVATETGWYGYTPVATYTTKAAEWIATTTTQAYTWNAATTAVSYSTPVAPVSTWTSTTPYVATYTGAASTLRVGGLVVTAVAVLGLALAL